MKTDLEELIDELEIDDRQKRYLRSRWLDQVLWMEAKAGNTQFYYYVLRITAIVGGVIVPALVGVNFDEQTNQIVRILTFVIGLLVAISVAVEGFFHYGERWRHYRSSVEFLKSEGWQFFQLSGRYATFTTHSQAYREFASRVEEILSAEVIKFVKEVVAEKPREAQTAIEPPALAPAKAVPGGSESKANQKAEEKDS
jgi:hypothetical protein